MTGDVSIGGDGANPHPSRQEQEQRHSEERERGGSWQAWSPCIWVAFLILLVAQLLAGVWIVWDFSIHNTTSAGVGLTNGSHTTDESHSNETDLHPVEQLDISAVRTNNYILDPNWDFNALPQRRVYNWTISNVEHNPDGIYRLMTLANNQFPGPMIEANEGDTIVVHVDNQAINATAIHWHGIYQNSTPHMDGTVGVTQCPIAPGKTFTYEFTVTGQSGTYWWHSHLGVQSSDGLHGPLIIHAKNEKDNQPVHYDTDRVLLISDHYHDLSSALLWQYLLPDAENAEPVPQGGLINGQYIRKCDDFPDRKCDNTSAHVGMPQLDFRTGQNHRLRLVNVGAFAEFQFQIDEHELAVTEVDGTDVEPISYHRLNINPAQRYSVILSTNLNSAKSFWLRARMISSCFAERPRTLETDVLGIVRYKSDEARHGSHGDEDVPIPESVDWQEQLEQECRDMNTTELRPVQVIATPRDPDAFFYLRSNFEAGAYRLTRGKFNESSWRPDIKSPSLHRAIDGLRSANISFQASDEGSESFVNSQAFDDERELVIQTTGVQTIDIVISNFDDGNHPIHLHGYKYFVLAQGHGYPPLTHVGADLTHANMAPLYDSLDFSNPLRRDTASVEAFGWILIRIIADNPGAWAFHCHVSWHTEAGLMMQLLTRTDELAEADVPTSHYNLCSADGIEKGSGPADEDLYQFAR